MEVINLSEVDAWTEAAKAKGGIQSVKIRSPKVDWGKIMREKTVGMTGGTGWIGRLSLEEVLAKGINITPGASDVEV